MFDLHLKSSMLLVLSSAGLVAGCDRLYRTQQPAEIMVTSPDSGRGIRDAVVEVARKHHDGWHPEMGDSERRNAWIDQFRQGHQTTGENGHARIHLEIETVCGGVFPGIFPGFDPRADRVTGVPYLFRIRTEGAKEILAVDMNPGLCVKGENFAVTVLSIGEATLQK